MPKLRRTLAGLVCIPAAIGLAATHAAHADVTQHAARDLATGATFNSPGGTEIVDKIESLIRGAPSGSDIEIAQYRLWDYSTMDKLEEAVHRGVHVRVLVDKGNLVSGSGSVNKRFQDFSHRLNTHADSDTWVNYCGTNEGPRGTYPGCNGVNAMHNKFFLFSQTHGHNFVVSTGSANLSNDSIGGTGGWNTLYTDVGDAHEDGRRADELHLRFHEYFKDMAEVARGAEMPDPDYYWHNRPITRGDTEPYFFPSQGRDTTVSSLDAVDCSTQPSTKIRVGMWSITRKAVAEALSDKRRCGQVEIVVNRMDAEACEILTSAPKPNNFTIRTFPRDEDGTDNPHGIHDKNMMIGGNYHGINGNRIVFTGSANLNGYSLRENDESVLRILNNKTVYDQFIRHFDDDLIPAASVTIGSGDCDKVANG